MLCRSLALGALLGILGVSGGAHASSPVISPELQVSPHPVSAAEPGVAVGNGVYLVVWTEAGHLSMSVLGVRVRASDGVVLDAEPLPISTGTYTIASAPVVASDGDTFLVVFTRMARYGTDVCTRRVRVSDGALPDAAPLCIGTTPENKNPSVAFDGTNYVVAWWGYYYPGNAAPFYAVTANWVRPSDGRPVLSNGILISAAPQATTPQVAAGNGNLLVAWEQREGSQGLNVLGARVDTASKTRIDSTPLPIAVGMEDEVAPAIASNGSDFLVVWGVGGNLQGTRVQGSDGALLDGAGFHVVGPGVTPASVTFDGSDYWVAWQGAPAGVRGLFSRRVSTQGTVEPGWLVSTVHPSTTWTDVTSIAAVAPGSFLVAYPQFDSQQGLDRIKARRVEDVQQQPCDVGTPTLVLTGGAELTLECKAGTPYSDPGVQAFDGCGNPLQVHAYNTGNDSSGPGPNLGAEGTYMVSYAAWDAMGHTVNAQRTVSVEDRTAPALSLKGDPYMVHWCGSQWVDPGVTAMDACYGNLSPQVWHSGEVNGWAEGRYTVTYSLTDSGGNSAAPVSRTVEVVNCPW